MLKKNNILSSFMSLILALLIGEVVIGLSGFSPLMAYSSMIVGALGSTGNIVITLQKSVPLLLCGLSVAVALKGGELSWSFVIVVVTCLIIYALYRYICSGYEMIAVGMNRKAAEAGGININSVSL